MIAEIMLPDLNLLLLESWMVPAAVSSVNHMTAHTVHSHSEEWSTAGHRSSSEMSTTVHRFGKPTAVQTETSGQMVAGHCC